jgi:hypothetical protein
MSKFRSPGACEDTEVFLCNMSTIVCVFLLKGLIFK